MVLVENRDNLWIQEARWRCPYTLEGQDLLGIQQQP